MAEPADRLGLLDPSLKMESEESSERSPLAGTRIRTFWQQRRAQPGFPVRSAPTLRTRQPAMRTLGGM
jgi:hypothetical protein